MARCKSCGAEIIWATTSNGKKVPLDVKAEKRYVLYGRSGETAKLVNTYVTHFVTCPDAKVFRKKDD